MSDRLEAMVAKALEETLTFEEEIATSYEAVMNVVGPLIAAADELANQAAMFQHACGINECGTLTCSVCRAVAEYRRIRADEQ